MIGGRKVTGSFESFPAEAGKEKDSLTAEDKDFFEKSVVGLFLFEQAEIVFAKGGLLSAKVRQENDFVLILYCR